MGIIILLAIIALIAWLFRDVIVWALSMYLIARMLGHPFFGRKKDEEGQAHSRYT